jgi:hypothetical protein
MSLYMQFEPGSEHGHEDEEKQITILSYVDNSF